MTGPEAAAMLADPQRGGNATWEPDPEPAPPIYQPGQAIDVQASGLKFGTTRKSL